ncbi:unnamed protein product [Calypogeia fissa]
MRKRAILATPSLAISLALNSFAASIVKEEEKKKKRQLSSSSTAAAADIFKDVNDQENGDDVRVIGEDSGAEGSSNRTEKRKRPKHGDDGNSNQRARKSSGVEPAAGSSPNEGDGGDSGAEVLQADWTLPTDTLVALKMMCQQFPKSDQMAVRPFVLRSQLYSSVSDRTTADRDLEELKQQHTVRIFKLNSGQDDFAIMVMEDYLKQIEEEKKRMEIKRPEEEISVFDWFATNVVPAHTGASIRQPHLLLLLNQAGKANDKDVSLLINAGLLVRQIADETTYWFGIPNVGSLLKSLSAGRKELLSFLSRRRYKEMLQSVLEKKRLRSSQFNMRFHVRDLIGSGHLFSIHTPAGPLIRLTRD